MIYDVFVNWNGFFSREFRTLCGVNKKVCFHLCYLLFMSMIFKGSGLGSHIGSMCFDCIMYADDLVISAVSLTVLQALIDLCAYVAENSLICHLMLKSLPELVLLLDTFVHLLI